MRYRFTMDDLKKMTDKQILRALITERTSTLNPFAPLAVRLKKIYAELNKMSLPLNNQKKIKLTVVFGEMPVNDLCDGEALSDVEVEENGTVCEYDFSTEADRNMFLSGINDMDGWNGFCVVEQDEDGKYKELED